MTSTIAIIALLASATPVVIIGICAIAGLFETSIKEGIGQ